MSFNLSVVKSSIKAFGEKAAFNISRHAPAIALTVGIGCGVAAAVTLAIKSTKISPILEEASEKIQISKDIRDNKIVVPDGDKYGEKDCARDVTKIYIRTAGKLVKHYAVPIGLGMLSIASICYGYNTLNKSNAALAGAITSLTGAYNDFRSKVVKEIGEDKVTELERNVKKIASEDNSIFGNCTKTDEKTGETKKEPIVSHGPYEFIFDAATAPSKWCRNGAMNLAMLQGVEGYYNTILRTRGYVTLNEVLRGCGLTNDESAEGLTLGWYYDTKRLERDQPDAVISFGLKKLSDIDLLTENYDCDMLLRMNCMGDIPTLMKLSKSERRKGV